MKAGQSKGFASQPAKQKNRVLQKSVYATIYDVTLGWLLKKLWLGLMKWWVAIKYQWHQRTGGVFGNWRLSWFKVGLAVLVIFIIVKKDIQFSVNMKAPVGSQKTQNAQATSVRNNVSELSVADGLNLGSKHAIAASLEDLDDQRVKNYIKRFTKVAQAEMQRYGVPASVKMAQAIVESWAGTQATTLSSNNHFGAPMSNRSYDSAWENWRVHSLLLRDQYPQLFKSGTNYKKWAKGLKDAHYNDDRRYAQKIMDVIERYELYLLDEQ